MRWYKRKMLHRAHISDCSKLVELLGLASESIPDTSPLISSSSQQMLNNSSEIGNLGDGL
jgi:hypothetical protein